MNPLDLPKFSPRRALGRTGFAVTAVGAGDLADRSQSIEECAATLRAALDAGINLVDTAPGYEDGYSEQVVGAALEGRREGVFVVDKIDHHDQPVAEQVEGSLARLGMDHADLFLFHGVSTLEGWRGLVAEGGGFDQLATAIKQGKARLAGISSHHPEVLRRALESGRCDVVMFALGAHADRRYVDEILPLARAKNVGTIGFKAFGAGKLLGDTEGYGRPLENPPARPRHPAGDSLAKRPLLPHLTVEECVNYIRTVDPDVSLLGMSTVAEMRVALKAAEGFRPLTPTQLDDLRQRAEAAVLGKGRCWWNPA
jgi:aryl-alcohol dehydrogenase-like predicted oxidoreductase